MNEVVRARDIFTNVAYVDAIFSTLAEVSALFTRQQRELLQHRSRHQTQKPNAALEQRRACGTVR
ncbi:MAG: hypothetical protein Q4G24_06355 [Paracoccus sp. (in: a-proteobacteria)]|uniref:hypothetical protein n=1 Tax=Paracoccus sp. TaxID=267 RepID=UPI0026DFD494|nr:hypothetical protein [Paracoccus sp. (in: a-proteobacteria)]MDO5621074.1 hypothetical protein [Paracoccus sp. (in: a-proteobacteria)]